ncbi:hypothetical protein SAMN04488038_11082 [Solimonas aquatica]|uniref:Outer membrane protein beta-barrel domain-containing protein n=1 Tax=Solimonas aquatica TaxID=489703 RepID=A0A1H9IL85_9GAMM|nr:hypothetical protein [Solimonas aquatica]SEQ75318.1 hypothetical protein SAMN04488038_11082 [Solimonas aquatica]
MSKAGKLQLLAWGRRVLGAAVLLGAWMVPQASFAEGFEYAFTVGQNSGAYDTGSGLNVGGTLSVPILNADPLFKQELMGEIILGYARTDDNGTFTAPNVTGLGLAAEPTPDTMMHLSTFQVGAGLKYKLVTLPYFGFVQVQPYLSAGAAFHVFLAYTNGNGSDRVGGIAPISPELEARGFPAGEGNVMIGVMYGVGTDFIFFDKILLGVDARWNEIANKGSDYMTLVGKVGFRF